MPIELIYFQSNPIEVLLKCLAEILLDSKAALGYDSYENDAKESLRFIGGLPLPPKRAGSQ